jgi:tetratricopeptide (TPR) repeat protein
VWNKFVIGHLSFVICQVVALTFNASGQDTACRNRYSARISMISGWVGAGHFSMASDVLDALEKEVSPSCSDSGLLADLSYLRGNIALLTDDPETALLQYWNARKLAVSAGQLSRIDQNTGAAWFALNDYERARRYFSHALSELQLSGVNIPRRKLDLYNNLGASCYEEGALDKAEKWWNLALSVASSCFPDDSMIKAELVHSAALVFFGLQRSDTAVVLFRFAMESNPGKDDLFNPFTAMVRRNLAMALLNSGSVGEADDVLEVYDPAGDDPVFRAEILRLRAWICYAGGLPVAADSLIADGLRVVEESKSNFFPELIGLITFRLLRDRASIHYLRNEMGTDPNIMDLYSMQKKALAALDSIRDQDGKIPGFIFRHDSVGLLLERTLQTGHSLMVSGQASATELLSLVSCLKDEKPLISPVHPVETSLPDQALQKKWLDVNRQLYRCERRELQAAAQSGVFDPQSETVLFNLHNSLDSLGDLLRATGGPAPVSAMNTGKLSMSITNRVAPGEAILDYLCFPNRIYVFIVRHDTTRLVMTRTGPGFFDTLAGFRISLKTADDLLFRQTCPVVSGRLISPVVPWLEDIHRINIVTSGLDRVPFECLELRSNPETRQTYVANRFTVLYHRSVAAFAECRSKILMVPGPVLEQPECEFVGFSPSSPVKRSPGDLSHSSSEVEEIGELFARQGCSARIFKEEESNEATFMSEVTGSSVVHLATHSKVDTDFPIRSGLRLWKESPLASGDELIDGILELGELRGMRLNCSLLTLSSCTLSNTERSSEKLSPGPESFFLDAGAQNVVSSLWNVSDRHTRTLMCDFYRFVLAGDDYAEALRKAKVKMLSNPATSSPYLWAPFILSAN